MRRLSLISIMLLYRRICQEMQYLSTFLVRIKLYSYKITINGSPNHVFYTCIVLYYTQTMVCSTSLYYNDLSNVYQLFPILISIFMMKLHYKNCNNTFKTYTPNFWIWIVDRTGWITVPCISWSKRNIIKTYT